MKVLGMLYFTESVFYEDKFRKIYISFIVRSRFLSYSNNYLQTQKNI